MLCFYNEQTATGKIVLLVIIASINFGVLLIYFEI